METNLYVCENRKLGASKRERERDRERKRAREREKLWIDNHCFEIALLKNAHNIVTSRYVVKWKYVKDERGNMVKTIRMRLVLGLYGHRSF